MFGLFRSKNKNITSSQKIEEVKTNIQPPQKTLKFPNKLNKEQLNYLKDEEIIEYLKKLWDIKLDKPIEVWGEISSYYNINRQRYFFKLINVKDKNNKILEYPIKDWTNRKFIKSDGIYISPKLSSDIKEK